MASSGAANGDPGRLGRGVPCAPFWHRWTGKGKPEPGASLADPPVGLPTRDRAAPDYARVHPVVAESRAFASPALMVRSSAR